MAKILRNHLKQTRGAWCVVRTFQKTGRQHTEDGYCSQRRETNQKTDSKKGTTAESIITSLLLLLCTDLTSGMNHPKPTTHDFGAAEDVGGAALRVCALARTVGFGVSRVIPLLRALPLVGCEMDAWVPLHFA